MDLLGLASVVLGGLAPPPEFAPRYCPVTDSVEMEPGFHDCWQDHRHVKLTDRQIVRAHNGEDIRGDFHRTRREDV